MTNLRRFFPSPVLARARNQQNMGLSKNRFVPALVLLSFSFLVPDFGAAVDVLTSSKFIKDPEAIVSAGNKFKLGFFSPVNSSFRYVGIWNSDVPTTMEAMWVANRNSPINDSSGVMRISDDGNLIVSNGHGEILWSSDVSGGVSNSSAQLKDDGNLVLRSNTTGSSDVWQSFQQPCDTFVPNMELSTNPSTGAKIQLTSWKSPSDPSVGSFSGFIDPDGIPQYKVLKGNQTYWRSGPWDGNSFLGIPGMGSVYLSGFNLGRNGGSFNFRFILPVPDGTILIKYLLSFDGKFRQLDGNYGKGTWNTSWMVPENDCDLYGKCGEFGICDPQNSPICSCLQGFEPEKLDEWNSGNWTNGCARKALLQCERAQIGAADMGKIDGFFKKESVKVPDFAEWSFASSEQSCRDECLGNCSCIAYAYNIGFGCMLWRRNLIDIKQFSQGRVDLNLRLAYSEFDGRRRNLKVIISLSVSIGAVTIVMCVLLSRCLVAKYTGRKKSDGQTLLSKGKVDNSPSSEENMAGDNIRPGRLQEVPLFNLQNQKVLGARSRINQVELQELPVFSLQKLTTATDNFALSNKLGQGGFGPVYKGKLPDGQEIAVKRLSRASGQGVEEFMNEVLVISKLQHRNLVRLLGCCVEGEEKMLVYEYMPNKSLDSFLFDPIRKEALDWRKRSNIVEGICRGLLYLHRDSRLRIIHRDLKVSNILLDQEMNPKISDFGMARIFGGNEDQADTNRVVGTYGYMSPEYAMEGRFSEKSDVFSFGVLLLEIVCGRRNSSFYNELEMSLLGLAWKLWNESKMSSLVDPTLSDECFADDILRCIHVGLLCVQESAKDRPAVSTVISMLNSEIVDLPTPNQPAFIGKMNGLNTESIRRASKTDSVSTETITCLDGR